MYTCSWFDHTWEVVFGLTNSLYEYGVCKNKKIQYLNLLLNKCHWICKNLILFPAKHFHFSKYFFCWIKSPTLSQVNWFYPNQSWHTHWVKKVFPVIWIFMKFRYFFWWKLYRKSIYYWVYIRSFLLHKRWNRETIIPYILEI